MTVLTSVNSPIFAGALHNLALCEFIDHLILVELFLALDAVVVVHDVFHIPAGRLTNPAATATVGAPNRPLPDDIWKDIRNGNA